MCIWSMLTCCIRKPFSSISLNEAVPVFTAESELYCEALIIKVI